MIHAVRGDDVFLAAVREGVPRDRILDAGAAAVRLAWDAGADRLFEARRFPYVPMPSARGAGVPASFGADDAEALLLAIEQRTENRGRLAWHFQEALGAARREVLDRAGWVVSYESGVDHDRAAFAGLANPPGAAGAAEERRTLVAAWFAGALYDVAYAAWMATGDGRLLPLAGTATAMGPQAAARGAADVLWGLASLAGEPQAPGAEEAQVAAVVARVLGAPTVRANPGHPLSAFLRGHGAT